MFKHYKYITITLAVFGLCSCKKLIEIEPPIQQITASTIYQSDAGAASVLTGIYTSMSLPGIFAGAGSIAVRTGLSADELITNADPSNILQFLYQNKLTNNGNQLFWNDLYNYVYKVNAALEGLDASKSLTPAVKQQLQGEAKFLRAFFYFYLVNLYGDVPLVTGSDPEVNGNALRAAKQTVYQQMVTDLTDAIALLKDNYVYGDVISATEERTRPNKPVALALLARIYLYTGQWSQAEETATLLINDSRYILPDLAQSFLKNNTDAIWQLQPVVANFSTEDARVFNLGIGDNYAVEGPDGQGRPVYMSDFLFNAFEPGDNRKSQWVNQVTVGSTIYPYAYKYKVWIINEPRTEYLNVFRVAEQYLVRAEARAQSGKLTGAGSAVEDINMIRLRAGLEETRATSSEQILDAILQERRVELFTEFGHRWLDLKRTGTIDNVMNQVAPSKQAAWEPYKALYPLPVEDIKRNPSLRGHQNPGYPEQ